MRSTRDLISRTTRMPMMENITPTVAAQLNCPVSVWETTYSPMVEELKFGPPAVSNLGCMKMVKAEVVPVTKSVEMVGQVMGMTTRVSSVHSPIPSSRPYSITSSGMRPIAPAQQHHVEADTGPDAVQKHHRHGGARIAEPGALQGFQPHFSQQIVDHAEGAVEHEGKAHGHDHNGDNGGDKEHHPVHPRKGHLFKQEERRENGQGQQNKVGDRDEPEGVGEGTAQRVGLAQLLEEALEPIQAGKLGLPRGKIEALEAQGDGVEIDVQGEHQHVQHRVQQHAGDKNIPFNFAVHVRSTPLLLVQSQFLFGRVPFTLGERIVVAEGFGGGFIPDLNPGVGRTAAGQ